jgi:hypothetical protein
MNFTNRWVLVLTIKVMKNFRFFDDNSMYENLNIQKSIT